MRPDAACRWARTLCGHPDLLGDCYLVLLDFDDEAHRASVGTCNAWLRRCLPNRRRDRIRKAARRRRLAPPAPMQRAERVPAAEPGFAAVDDRDELAAALRACPPALQRMLRVYAHAGSKAEAARLLGYRHRQAFTRRLHQQRSEDRKVTR